MYYGNSFADLATMRLEAKIKGVYAQAYREIEEKLNRFLGKSAIREKDYLEKVKSGEMTQSEFDRWKSGQIFIGKRWRDLRQNIAEEIYNSRKSATDMINGERKAVFQNNVNYAQYTIDKDYKFGVSFTIYDNATVTRLIKDDPDLLPDVKYPDPQIDYAWSKKQITSAITQGVLQGESIPNLAKRIGRKLESSNAASMVRVARTAMTGAQNSGRIQAMHNAQDMGIQVQKLWISTIDGRTRDSHRDLDGQLAEVDKPFNSILGEIMFPGDPNASPANTWNCRCTLGWEYPEYRNQYDTRAARDFDWEEGGQTEQIQYMTFNEWLKWIQNGKPEHKKVLTGIEYFHQRYKDFENIDKIIEEHKRKIADYDKVIWDLDSELYDIKKQQELLKKDFSAYDKFIDYNDFDREMNKYRQRIEELTEQYYSLRKNRPRTDDFATEEEFERAFRKYISDRDKIIETKQALEKELYNYYNADWNDIKKQRALKATGIDYDELYKEKERQIENAKNEKEKHQNELLNYRDLEIKETIVKVALDLEKKGVEYLDVPKSQEKNEDEIINKLAGGDLTKGSCASLAFCYAMQKNGHDVIDFRDGISRKTFSMDTWSILDSINANSEKNVLIKTSGRYTTDAAIKALEKAEVGKEYYLCTGRHASIIRKDEYGMIQYLELQSAEKNGWKFLGDTDLNKKYLREMIKWRFGADGKTTPEAKLIDINDIAANEDMVNLMGYINTRENEQRKGSKGHER